MFYQRDFGRQGRSVGARHYEITNPGLNCSEVNSRRPAFDFDALRTAPCTTRGLLAMACTASPRRRLVVAGPSSWITTGPALEATPPPMVPSVGRPPKPGSAVPLE